jgi:hypothetical protein
MFGSAILDIAIGLMFVYLLLSLIVTAVNELIETFIKLRAAQLAQGVAKLLGKEKAEEFFKSALIKGLSPKTFFGNGSRKPSYIPAQTFASAVLNLIAPAEVAAPRTIEKVKDGINSLPAPRPNDEAPDLKTALTILLEESQRDLDRLEQCIAVWFDRQMERVAGWYKRKASLITFVVGLAITVLANVDSIRLCKALSSDSALRASLVAQAQEAVKQPLPGPPDKGDTKGNATKEYQAKMDIIEQRVQKLEGLGLPIGWAGQPSDTCALDRILGWLLTTFAVSLGAPFWFDLLSRLIKIRATGKNEKPKTEMPAAPAQA